MQFQGYCETYYNKFLTDEITKIDKLINECKNTSDNSKISINYCRNDCRPRHKDRTQTYHTAKHDLFLEFYPVL